MNIAMASRLSLAALLLGLVAACSTAPSQHYILRAREVPPASTGDLSIGVGPVTLPNYLQRNNFVITREQNRLQIDSTERWAEPLENGISRVISINLAGLLDTQDVRSYPWHPKRLPDFAVQLRVLEMEADSSEARLIAEWLLLSPGSDGALERRIAQFQQALPANADAGAMAAAYSDLLYQLSRQIAEAVKAARPGTSGAAD
ncbi:PqiC family protein [Haliea sp. E17]|uniref:PqiC family protein n=1 Tax=Haliea sp. E17 TaxID=3401576 RepID=UPI003AAD4B36